MITKLLRKVFRRDKPAAGPVAPPGPAVIAVEQHGVVREKITPGARHVCDKLQAAGFKAYVVGGAVRDLIAGLEPKDFDVATDATPEQVVQQFRRARMIGRRFRIVHVMQGRETIEVSTFRASNDAETDEHGRILRDNVFGSQAEDASRRDFTVNALYYDPGTQTILDYHHGVADLQQKTLRMIGEPRRRYREDPIRMLRAVRLGTKLGLTLDSEARAPIREMAELLENVPPARLFDEMLKLLTCGDAWRCVRYLREEGLHHGLLPLLDVILEQPLGERFVMLALERTDRRVREGKTISPGFLFATLLWHEVLANWEARRARDEASIPALLEAMNEVLDMQAEKLAISKRIASDIREIWVLQARFDMRSGKRPYRLLEQPRFRAGLDFLELRAESGEVQAELADWWRDFADADGPGRESMLIADSAPKKRRRRRRKAGSEQDEAPAAVAEPESGLPSA
ncbi:MAG: polynucleotide adenylyltransferase PcnB [Rhodocyclaceae bacterium]|nr:polynucleotide adenylyltransferase PcnB [Rhodocyclaceae bacterium]